LVEFPRRRWPFFAISVLGLAIGLWGMQGLLKLSAPPPGYPVNPILYPARVGPVVVGSADELRFISQSRPAGSMVEIRSDAGVVHARLEPQVTKFHFGIILLEGLLFLAVGLFVFAPRAERGPMRDLYWCTLLYGIATMINGLYFPRAGTWTDWVFPAIRIACLAFLPVFFFRMAQAFPRLRKRLDLNPRLMRGLWIAAGILVVWQVAASFRYFADPRPEVWRGMSLPRSLAHAFLVGAVGLGCLTLYRGGRKLELARERGQVKWLLWGLAIGAIPYVFLRTFPRLLDVASGIPPELDRIFEMAIPVALACAVLPFRSLDIDLIIRRSLLYGTLTPALAGIYLLVGVAPAPWMKEHAPQYATFLQIIAVAIPMVLYAPFRRWTGIWVDRTFYKIQYDYARAIRAFLDAARRAPSQDEIAELCRGFLEEQLVIESAVVVARRDDTLVAAGDADDLDAWALLESLAAAGVPRKLLAAPNSTSRPDLETPEFPAILAEAGFKLAAPLSAGGQSLGGIFLGAKKSGERFIEENLKLLYAVRAEAETALERVDLVQRAAQEAHAREKAPEIERALARQSRVDLLPLVQEAVAVMKPAARERNIQFELNVAPNLRPVRGDRTQLLEIVTNLLENAACHSPDGQAVEVTIERNSEGQMVIVCTFPEWSDA